MGHMASLNKVGVEMLMIMVEAEGGGKWKCDGCGKSTQKKKLVFLVMLIYNSRKILQKPPTLEYIATVTFAGAYKDQHSQLIIQDSLCNKKRTCSCHKL